jgi:ubiquinone/menaquinone biosynthesis C-methylase UbiE
VIDLGCGPGFFSIEMAKIVGSEGRVFAVDLQKQMLKKLEQKAAKENLNKQIALHNCSQKKIGLKNDIKADFILAFYMVHETPDHKIFLTEVKTMLKKEGRFLIVEPRFHVNKQHFQEITQDITDIGFKIIDTPAKKGGRSLLLAI